MPLHLIPPTEKPPERKNSRRRRALKPAEMLQCPRCAGREVIVTTIGVLLRDGKLTGGTKQVLCVGCPTRGERVVLG
jgi:hypothetical protein